MRLGSRGVTGGDAFSLIELMVVLLLMAIMAAMIIPEMKGTHNDAILRSTGRQLASVLSLAYSQAITVSQPHRVRLERTTGRYVLERAVRDGERGPGFVPVKEVRGSEGALDARIEIEIEIRQPSEDSATPRPADAAPPNDLSGRPTVEAIAFYPDGTAEAGEIRLRDRDGFGLALRINPTTARVRIVELERE